MQSHGKDNCFSGDGAAVGADVNQNGGIGYGGGDVGGGFMLFLVGIE